MYRLSILHNPAPDYVYNLDYLCVWFSSTCNCLVNLLWLFDKWRWLCVMRVVLILRLHTNTAAVQFTNSTSPHWVLKSSHQGPLFPTAPASQVYLSGSLSKPSNECVMCIRPGDAFARVCGCEQKPNGTDGGGEERTCVEDEEDGDGDGAGVWDEGQGEDPETQRLWVRGTTNN